MGLQSRHHQKAYLMPVLSLHTEFQLPSPIRGRRYAKKKLKKTFGKKFEIIDMQHIHVKISM